MEVRKVIDDNLGVLIALGVGLLAISFLNRKKKPKRTKEQVKADLCETKYEFAHIQPFLTSGNSPEMSEADKKYKKTWLKNCMKTHIVEERIGTKKGNPGWSMRKIVS